MLVDCGRFGSSPRWLMLDLRAALSVCASVRFGKGYVSRNAKRGTAQRAGLTAHVRLTDMRP